MLGIKQDVKLSRSAIIFRVILFFLLSTYGYQYLKSYFSLPSIELFSFLDQLTGKPYLAQRVGYFIFAITLYAFFTLVLDKEKVAQAFSLFNPLFGLLKGTGYALSIVALEFILLVITQIIQVMEVANTWDNIAFLVLAWVIAQFFNAIKEEIIYRGYLQRKLASKFNKHLSVMLISFLFGVGHYAQYHIFGTVFATVSGMILGYVYLYYENIYIPIAMHAVMDISSHTLLSGKILSFNPGHNAHWLGLSEEASYFIMIITANILFLLWFFISKRLWRF